MEIKTLIDEISDTLTAAFNKLGEWFDAPETVRNYRPAAGGWTIDEVLEHVALTNHYLLILIEKGAAKALKNLHGLDLNATLASYEFQREKLIEIGRHKSFSWIRPAHMEPTGLQPMTEIRRVLHEQLIQCQAVLDKLSGGEGVRYRTTMSVNELGKIDVYEFVYFLAKHAERHLTQIEKAVAEQTQNN